MIVMTMFGLPESTLGWIIFAAIASAGVCMIALGTIVIVDKSLAMTADWPIFAQSALIGLLIVVGAVLSWLAAFSALGL